MKMKREDFARGLNVIGHKADLIIAHVGHKVLPVMSDTSSTTTTRERKTSPVSKSSVEKDQCRPPHPEQKEEKKVKGDDQQQHHKAKTLARMKELIKKAAAAKTEKAGKYFGRKVLYFRNRGILRSVADDQLSTESPKISFRWDVESYSTTTSSCISRASSSFKPAHMPSKLSMDYNSASDLIQDDIDNCCAHRPPGSWITTDSEFVVLEL